jgi:hypothetical protein
MAGAADLERFSLAVQNGLDALDNMFAMRQK